MMKFTGNLELAEIHGVKTHRIDMHSHVLPAFDDGAKDLKESLSIMKHMKEKGLEVLFWTPHLNLSSFPQISDESIEKHYHQHVELIRKETGIEILKGSELYCSPPLPEKIVPLGKSDFVLIEFPLDCYPRYLFDMIYSLQLNGYRIVLAHVERYQWLFPTKKKWLKNDIDYSLVEALKEKGVYFQVNYMTIENIVHYPFLFPVLKEQKVEFIGSDKHTTNDGRGVIDFEKIASIEH